MIDKPPLFEGSFGSPEKQAGAPIRDVRQIFDSSWLQQQTAANACLPRYLPCKG